MSNPYAASDWTRRNIQKQNIIEEIARKLTLSGMQRDEIKKQCDAIRKLSWCEILEYRDNI